MSTPTYQLPFWMDGDRATALKRTTERWWDEVDGYLRLPLTTFDVLTCALAFVDLLAYQRGIDRFAGESEAFYRLRVHHALRNARSAGTPVGMRQIFDNLRLPQPRMAERLPNRAWDMTRLTYSGRDYARLHAEIDFVLRFYWRTCRRFELVQEVKADTQISAGLVGQQRSVNVAQNVPNAVPFRPATTRLAVGLVGQQRSVNVAQNVPTSVPFRPATNRLAVGLAGQQRSVNVAQNVPTAVPTRRLTMITPTSAHNFLATRCVNIRKFAA